MLITVAVFVLFVASSAAGLVGRIFPSETNIKTAGGNPGDRDPTLDLLARLAQAEVKDGSYPCKLAVAAVVVNRTEDPAFPNTIAAVIYQPQAFGSVTDGRIMGYASMKAYRAAEEAYAGLDPTYGSLYFWNPYEAVSPHVWQRDIVTQIGRFVFAR